MAKQLFGNNASSLLAASISDSDLSIQVAGGFGALFPNPGADEYFLVTLENDSGDIEVVKISSRTTDLLTVPTGGRGQEGTSAQAWTNGQARVELRLTRGTMEKFLQRDGDEMTGDLNMNENEIQDAIITGNDSVIDSISEIINTPLRGATGDSSNEIVVPDDGSRATAGGQNILTAADTEEIADAAFVVGQVIMWYGAALSIPDGWALCNGANGTPDLRNRFIVGAGSTYNLGATGGGGSATTSSDGNHAHGGSTDAHTLTTAEMPSHTHSMPNVVTYPGSGLQYGGNASFQSSVSALDTGSAGSDQGHSHTIPDSGTHTHTVEAPLPPYYGLFFIMFVGF